MKAQLAEFFDPGIFESGAGAIESSCENARATCNSMSKKAEVLTSFVNYFASNYIRSSPRTTLGLSESTIRQASKFGGRTVGPYQGHASMATLTPTEITRAFLGCSAFLSCQELGETNQARVCFIFEEAHSLVPEWSSAVAEGDKAATNGNSSCHSSRTKIRHGLYPNYSTHRKCYENNFESVQHGFCDENL